MANFVTLIRILLALPVALSIVYEQFFLAFFLTLAGALTDLFDGRIARRNGSASGFGKAFDPLADKVFVLSILIALVDVGKLSSIPVVLLTIREFSVSMLRNLHASVKDTFGASSMGKLKTFVMFTAILLMLGGYQLGVYLLWLSVALAYISFYDYAKTYLKGAGLNYP